MKLYLKRLRQERGYTQEQMAKMVGEKPRTYGSWERGEAMLRFESCRWLQIKPQVRPYIGSGLLSLCLKNVSKCHVFVVFGHKKKTPAN